MRSLCKQEGDAQRTTAIISSNVGEDKDWAANLMSMVPALGKYGRTLCRNACDAEDLVQDTLMLAWRYRGRFQQGTNLRAWLFVIMTNRFRSNRRQRWRFTEDIDGRYSGRGSIGPEQEIAVLFRDLQRALIELPLDQRSALELVAVGGQTHKEAARILDCPIGTIKSRVQRARTRLVQKLSLSPKVDCSSDIVDRYAGWNSAATTLTLEN